MVSKKCHHCIRLAGITTNPGGHGSYSRVDQGGMRREGLEKIGFEEVGKDRTRSHGSLGKKDPRTLPLFWRDIEVGKYIKVTCGDLIQKLL